MITINENSQLVNDLRTLISSKGGSRLRRVNFDRVGLSDSFMLPIGLPGRKTRT